MLFPDFLAPEGLEIEIAKRLTKKKFRTSEDSCYPVLGQRQLSF